MTIALTVALAVCCGPQDPSSADSPWPQFRGPRADGTLARIEHPQAWGEEENIAWSVEVPGAGWSSPVVVGDRLFLTTAVDPDGAAPSAFAAGARAMGGQGGGSKRPAGPIHYEVRCHDLTDGGRRWTTQVGENRPEHAVHASNTYATESPATDGERIFATFGGLGEVVALSLEGEVQWRSTTGVFPTSNNFGWGSSLTVFDGLVFFQNDNETESFLLAFDAETGDVRWRADRTKGTSWATPTVLHSGERAQLVTCGAGVVEAYAPQTGEALWTLTNVGKSFSASPAADAEQVYVGYSSQMGSGPLIAVRGNASGAHELERRQDPEIVAWRNDRGGPSFPSIITAGGCVYSIGTMGVFACYDRETGDRLYRQRLPDSSMVVATPWADDERIFVLDESGKTFVIRAGEEYELLGVNELPGLYWATPSVAGDRLLLRSAERLTCVRAGGPAAGRGPI
ncbi:MAG: PQQ-binding-like beta-propeller repeat protein [Planctomycetota bacterium]